MKPANQGSSVGVSKVTSEAQYNQAVALAFEFDHKVVVEQGIRAADRMRGAGQRSTAGQYLWRDRAEQ